MSGRVRWLGGAGALLALAGCVCAGRTSPERPGTNPSSPSFLRAVDSDLGEAARRFADGQLTGRQYLDLASDRAAKARRYRDDPSWRDAAKQGDQDKDRVPDPLDRCPSPYLTPTNEEGCPPPTRPGTEPGPDDDQRTRDLLDQATFLFNPACDGSPAPRASNPLAWGHGTGDTRNTFFFVIGKVESPPPGCDVFYEMEFRIELLHLGPEPLVRYITVLFRRGEDITPLDSSRAVLSLPFGEFLTPARADLWGALTNARSVRWRVRAVNGAQATSSWSPMKAKNETVGLSF
jgi:hypothetical protein